FSLQFDSSRSGALHVVVATLGSLVVSGAGDGEIGQRSVTSMHITLHAAVVGDLAMLDQPPPPDLAGRDLAADLVMQDLVLPDFAMADLTMADVTMVDLAMVDLAVPDLAIPDFAIPDFAMPDFTPPPDLIGPDLVIPDLRPPSDVALPPDLVCVDNG